MTTKKEERKIGIPESEYREKNRIKKRQIKTKRLAMELWQLYSNVK